VGREEGGLGEGELPPLDRAAAAGGDELVFGRAIGESGHRTGVRQQGPLLRCIGRGTGLPEADHSGGVAAGQA